MPRKILLALAMLAAIHASAALAHTNARFSGSGGAFEMVGVVDGDQLIVYLDRFDDNAPLEGAKLSMQIAGSQLALKERAPGEFEAVLAQGLKVGVTRFTANVAAGGNTATLAADIVVAADDSESHMHGAHAHAPRRTTIALYATAAAVSIAALWWLRRRTRRVHQAGGAA